MEWFNENLPAEWQWVSLFLAVIGVLLAVFGLIMTSLEPLFGKPKLNLEFTTREIENSRGLICKITSPPIDNYLLKKLECTEGPRLNRMRMW